MSLKHFYDTIRTKIWLDSYKEISAIEWQFTANKGCSFICNTFILKFSDAHNDQAEIMDILATVELVSLSTL